MLTTSECCERLGVTRQSFLAGCARYGIAPVGRRNGRGDLLWDDATPSIYESRCTRRRKREEARRLYRRPIDGLMTTAECAERLGVTTRGFLAAAQRDGIQPVGRRGRQLLWSADDVRTLARRRSPKVRRALRKATQQRGRAAEVARILREIQQAFSPVLVDLVLRRNSIDHQ